MTFEVCEDCGSRVYSLGCVNCREEDYIEVEFAEELAEIRERERPGAPQTWSRAKREEPTR